MLRKHFSKFILCLLFLSGINSNAQRVVSSFDKDWTFMKGDTSGAEKITFNDDLAIVMGEEKIKPQGKQPNAGKLVTRRFTNVWKYSNSAWSIIARQATIIKVE